MPRSLCWSQGWAADGPWSPQEARCANFLTPALMKRFRTVLEKAAMGMGRWAWPARQVWNQLRKASGACNMASLEVWKVPVTEGFDLCDTQGDIPLYWYSWGGSSLPMWDYRIVERISTCCYCGAWKPYSLKVNSWAGGRYWGAVVSQGFFMFFGGEHQEPRLVRAIGNKINKHIVISISFYTVAWSPWCETEQTAHELGLSGAVFVCIARIRTQCISIGWVWKC